uniref:Uncharacterized protein n=1 Tax=Aegilops tauschii subsp. strangulata TaxID=200361 RepID=A0A453EBV9_AEGTS
RPGLFGHLYAVSRRQPACSHESARAVVPGARTLVLLRRRRAAEVWNSSQRTGTRAFTSEGPHLGKQTFFEKLHPLVITNLYSSNNKISASAASIVLVGSSEELGIISNCS